MSMLSRAEFVRQSLELHLFFARIMKEHAFFLQIGFTPKDINFTEQADELRIAFDLILEETIALSCGVVCNDVLQSGEVITQYTLEAEKATAFFTGIAIQTKLTQAEAGLLGGADANNQKLEKKVSILNRKTISLLHDIIRFKMNILSRVLSCKMFTINYPLLIDHILREAKQYLHLLIRLQRRDIINIHREAYEQEAFWNRIMAEHAKFIRGLLDPCEEELFGIANNFGKEFDRLTCEAQEAMDMSMPLIRVTEKSLRATKEIRDFKAQGTEGILECQIKSVIVPLLADHTLREANHYLRLLKIFH